jgi:hypothetical protein
MMGSDAPDVSAQDLAQEATGEGFDPDQTWPDEPDRGLPEDVDDPSDHNDDEPVTEV